MKLVDPSVFTRTMRSGNWYGTSVLTTYNVPSGATTKSTTLKPVGGVYTVLITPVVRSMRRTDPVPFCTKRIRLLPSISNFLSRTERSAEVACPPSPESPEKSEPATVLSNPEAGSYMRILPFVYSAKNARPVESKTMLPMAGN